MSGQRPTLKLKAFPLELAIWKHERDGKTHYSAKLSKSYKDDDSGEWKNTDFLNERDWLIAASLLSRAYMEIGIQKDA